MALDSNAFRRAPESAPEPVGPPAKAIVIIQRPPGQSGTPHQCEYTGLNLPRIGEQLDLDIGAERHFVTVLSVRHSQIGLPVIFAAPGETMLDTLTVIQMGVANLVARMDAFELRFEQMVDGLKNPQPVVTSPTTESRNADQSPG